VGLPLSVRSSSAPLTKVSLRVSWRAAVFGTLTLAYVLLTLGVIFKSPVLTLDTDLVNLHLRAHHPDWQPWVYYYVMFGQRGPATLLFLPFFIWVAWRRRSTEPLVMLGAALVLLNLSVGIVKVATGRLGPLRHADVHAIFVGGNIYPSGHVSNTVVLYGLMAWIALSHRRLAVAAAVFLSVTVGMGTIYLNTHWFSDVVGGWLAGGLVLVALPTVMPAAQRWTDSAIAWVRLRWAARAGVPRQVLAMTPRRIQRTSTPVNSVACSHNFVATVSSFEALDDPTRVG
jgi:membrane-associated phospholipid phosphatase